MGSRCRRLHRFLARLLAAKNAVRMVRRLLELPPGGGPPRSTQNQRKSASSSGPSQQRRSSILLTGGASSTSTSNQSGGNQCTNHYTTPHTNTNKYRKEKKRDVLIRHIPQILFFCLLRKQMQKHVGVSHIHRRFVPLCPLLPFGSIVGVLAMCFRGIGTAVITSLMLCDIDTKTKSKACRRARVSSLSLERCSSHLL